MQPLDKCWPQPIPKHIHAPTIVCLFPDRLRKKKRQRRNGNSHDDAMSLDSQMPPAPPPHSFPMTAIPPPPHHANPPPPAPPSGRSYWLAWWKPSSNNNADAFDARPAPPPSYDAAMMHSVTDSRRAPNRGGEFDYDYEAAEGDGDEDDDDSVSGTSQAPPYSEIHHDPIIPDWVNPVTTATAQPVSLPPQAADPSSFAASTGLPETARDRRLVVHRAGAALVLPVRPPEFSVLRGGQLRRPRSQMESRQVDNLGDGRSRGHRQSSSSSSSSSGRRPLHSTLPSGVLMNLNARSREGIVVPPSLPSQERDAALQRFSLQLQLNISDSSDSSTSAFEGVADTATAQVEESPASSSISSSENQ